MDNTQAHKLHLQNLLKNGLLQRALQGESRLWISNTPIAGFAGMVRALQQPNPVLAYQAVETLRRVMTCLEPFLRQHKVHQLLIVEMEPGAQMSYGEMRGMCSFPKFYSDTYLCLF
jgi:hypothetical protein